MDQSKSNNPELWPSSIEGEELLQPIFNPSKFMIPGWKGEGLITASAIVIKNALSNFTIDARAFFLKSCASNKTMRLQTYNEFLLFAKSQNLDINSILHQNDFWIHLQDDSSPLKKSIDEFVKIYCFRAVAVYLFRIKFILDLSKELNIEANEDTLVNPLTYLNKIFKKDSSTELHCDSLQVNQYSWYRPTPEYKDLLSKLKESFEGVTLTELIKLISTPKDDQIYSIKNYSHSVSHLSYGLLVNELLIKFPTWLKPVAKNKSYNAEKVCLLPKTMNTRFVGNHISSMALSHWLAQETNIKVSTWNNLICPDFLGSEFIDGQFLKICQELQFLSFLTRIAIEHKYEVVPFICKIMREKYQQSPDDITSQQSSFFNLSNIENGDIHFSRIVLNITELPKTNPHHYLISQIQGQKDNLKKDGIIYVFSNQKLFVPSHSDRVEQLLKDFKVEASFNLEDLKGKGEIAHFIYVLSKREKHQQTDHANQLFAVNKNLKESTLSFEIKGSLSRFNKFNKIYEEFKSFLQSKNPITTPLYTNDIDPEISFEFHQDAIIQGKLVSSASTKDSGHLPHPSFFKNLTKSCTSLDTSFHIEHINPDDFLQAKKNLASELLGLKFGPEKQYPLILIINQTDPMNVVIELSESKSLRGKIDEYGTAFYYYFGLIPKRNLINLNVFREFFASPLGHQIIQLQLSDGPSKLKAKLRSLLVPTFFGKTLLMPTEISQKFQLLDSDVSKLKLTHPETLANELRLVKNNFEELQAQYPWHILGLLSHFKQQLLLALDFSELKENNKSFELFDNPLISNELIKLKTFSIYPNNADIYVDLKLAHQNDLKLPLTSLNLKIEDKDSILSLKFQEREIVQLHAPIIMNQFVKFVLQNATGIQISDLIVNLKVPSLIELESTMEKVFEYKDSKNSLLNETENMIAMILRNQISN